MKYAFSTFFTQKAGKEEKAEKLKIHLALKIFFLVCSQTLDGVIWTQYFKYSGCLFANIFLCMSVCLSAFFRSDNCFLYKLSNLGICSTGLETCYRSCYTFRLQWLNILPCPPSKVLFTFLTRYYLGLTESSGSWLPLFLADCLFTFQFSHTIIGRLVTSVFETFFLGGWWNMVIVRADIV